MANRKQQQMQTLSLGENLEILGRKTG